jgi:IS605 OrfB family transposase
LGSLISTTRVRLPAGPHDAELDRAGDLFGRLERRLHVALRAIDRKLPGAAENRNALKVAFCARHRITARHYNSLLRALDGKHASVVEKAKIDIVDLEDRLKAVRKKTADAVIKLDRDTAARAGIAARAAEGKPPTKGQAKDQLNDTDQAGLRRGVHGRRRRADRLEGRLVRLRALTKIQVPPIVFGTRKLLRSRPQDGTEEEMAAWLLSWREVRSAQIFSVGSKDEPGGSQCCRPLWDGWADGTIGLRLRRLGPVPAGASPHFEVTGIPLNRHAAALLGPVRYLFERGGSTAVTVRLVRTPSEETVPEGASRWEALITVDEAVPDAPALAGGRVLGVDVNADHLAWALLSPDGNRLRTGRIGLPLDGRSAEARRSLICEAASALVKIATTEGARIALEDLDFARKKRELSLRPESANRRRRLHALPYAAVLEAVTRRAARAGVPVVRMNPAYTSVIGRVNLATRHGTSTHRAAALAIGRRAQGHSERPHYPLGRPGDTDPSLGAVQPRRHVWSHWAVVSREVSRLDAVARKSAVSRGGESPTPGPGPFRGRRPASGRSRPNPSAAVTDWIPDFPKVPSQDPMGNTVTPLATDKILATRALS